jgi:hypothetical protein
MKKLIPIFCIILCFLGPAQAVDVEFNSPSDQTPATLIAVAKSLGIWNSIQNQVINGQVDAFGSQWAVYVEGIRYSCTGTYPSVICTPTGTGYFVHLRYTGKLSGVGTPPVIPANIAVGGTPSAPTFTWIGSSPAPGSVTITVDDHTHAAWE